jgi:hypothetical protein
MLTQIFDSVTEMIDAADRAFQAGRRQRTDTELRKDAEWVGRRFDGWDDVKAKVGAYWAEGLDIVQEMLFELRDSCGSARPKSRKRRARWSADDGDEVDLDRLRSGQEPWRRMAREQMTAPQNLVLVFNLSTSASRDAADVLWRGAAAIILSDLLETAGFRVELWACNYVKNGYTIPKENAFQAVKLKASESPVDIASLTNGIAGWFFRTVVFQSYHVPPDATPNSSLGTPQRITEELEQVKQIAGNARVLTVDDVWDKGGAAALVKQVMAEME